MRGPVSADSGAMGRGAIVGPVIRDACPSVHEPFAQLDGALVRIRVPGGTLRGGDVRKIAEATSAYGTVLEITSRANLQMRGVTSGAHHLLVKGLVAAGLTLADAAADARRNVLASPTAGIDPCELTDTRPLVAAILGALVGAEAAGLSPKFGVLIDGGGAVHVRGRRQDICLGAVRRIDGPSGYEVRLGRPLPELADAEPRWVVSSSGAGTLVGGMLDLMAEHPESGGRMSGLVTRLGTEAVLRRAAERGDVALSEVRPSELELASTPSLRPIGELAQRGIGHSMVGAMPVLGRLSGEQLGAIATVAEDFCDPDRQAEVRLTPWRSVVIPNIPRRRAAAALCELALLGLAVDVTDPALGVVACAGSTGCSSSFTDTQRDGRAMVESLRRAARPSAFTVHLSGCSKRCADSTTAFDATLVGGPTAGTYEMVTPPDLCESTRRIGSPLDADAEAALATILSAGGSSRT